MFNPIRSLTISLFTLVLVLFAGCLIMPVSQKIDGGKCDKEKMLKYRIDTVIHGLDAVLVRQGFAVTSKEPARGILFAKKNGILASDYGTRASRSTISSGSMEHTAPS